MKKDYFVKNHDLRWVSKKFHIRDCILLFFVLLFVQILPVTSCDAGQSKQTFASPDAALWQAVAENNSEEVAAALKAGAYIDSKQIPEQVVEEHDWAHLPKVMTPFCCSDLFKKHRACIVLVGDGSRDRQ
jgi:hypothetical protein